MTIFTLDSDNNITALTKAPADPTNTFNSEKQLAALPTEWPSARLTDCWNSFAGVAPFDDLKPVKKFTDRTAAVARIWKAVQRLSASRDAVPPAAYAAPKAIRGTAKAKRRHTARTGAKQGAKVARDSSKKAQVLALMHRREGVTLAEIMRITGWQPHTVRGFVSGALTKRMGLEIESFRADDKKRTYRVTK